MKYNGLASIQIITDANDLASVTRKTKSRQSIAKREWRKSKEGDNKLMKKDPVDITAEMKIIP